MRRFLRELLAALGLVSARRHNAVVKQLETVKASAHGWKTRAVAASARSEKLESDLRRQAKIIEKLGRKLEAARQRREGDMQQLQALLVDTERELIAARDHLMAVEVKLNILEGAANVLDVRTRAAIVGRRNETGAPA